MTIRTPSADQVVAGPAGAGRRPGRPSSRTRRFGAWALSRIWLIIGLGMAWQLLARASDNPYFPPPSEIFPIVRDLWFSGPASDLFLTEKAIDDFRPSLAHILAGWFAASFAGIVLGVALGRSRTATDFLDPLLQFGRAIPPPTLIPFFIIVFHIADSMYIAVITFGVIWPVLLNTIDGARTVDALQLDTARVFGVSGWSRLWRVILPAAAPKIFAGLRVSLSLALILMVISELVGATAGIGDHLVNAQRAFQIPEMWAGIVLLGILGLLFNGIFVLVERRVLAWHRGALRNEG
ncbi:MAG TPA: ABC transporter permease [Streptosporangiaceae bacterium]|jgi:ABC-type nitrate/sulfonate/bicarbonate transport system permease component|nr:ABC transporter permease [Streptosporangiaceae bacterium]